MSPSGMGATPSLSKAERPKHLVSAGRRLREPHAEHNIDPLTRWRCSVGNCRGGLKVELSRVAGRRRRGGVGVGELRSWSVQTPDPSGAGRTGIGQ